MNNIMVCYDGTSHAKNALALAKSHAKAFGSLVQVVFVKKQSEDVKNKDVNKMVKANLQLEDIKNSLKQDQISCWTHLLISDLKLGEALVEYANSNKIDEIIIGIKKQSKVGKMIFGSTAQYVILNAPCPVITIK